jgi:phage protein D
VSFEVLFGDGARKADTNFYEQLAMLEVEENADLPGALQLTVPVASQGPPGREDLTGVGDDRFKPYARIAVEVSPNNGQRGTCIFDGHILSHRIHLDRGTTTATLRVWGQDRSCLMNLKEVVKEWSDTTDGQIANDIFGQYGLEKAPENDSGQQTEARHTVMQRSTDAQFLRDRARRNGKLFRVCHSAETGKNTGYFVKPSLEGEPVLTLTLNPPQDANLGALDFEWDVARPTQVLAQALLTDTKAEKRDESESGLKLLDSQSLAAFTGGQGDEWVMEARLTATADSVSDLRQRASSLLREAGWFVRCQGEVELARLEDVLRVATVVQIDGAGKLHSGKYFVWSVRHTITAQTHLMRFELVRNAVGSF